MAIPAGALIANGTCYTGPGTRAADVFFPCGNDLFGRKTCCGAGDMCLSSRACYNTQFGLTYLLGCSDPEYKHESCPDKGDALRENPWVGLVYCNGTSEQWVACPQDAKQSTLAKPDACFCPQTSRTVAFTDKSVLENIVSLPTVLGGDVMWQAGHYPIQTATSATDKSTPAPSASPTSGSGSTSGSSPPAQTGSSSETSAESGLSTTAKVGIGVGVGIGGSLLFAALIYLIFRHRRNRRGEAAELAAQRDHGPNSDMSHPKLLGVPGTPGTPATSVPSELEPTAARPWSLRSELESGTPVSLNGPQVAVTGQEGYAGKAVRPISELPG